MIDGIAQAQIIIGLLVAIVALLGLLYRSIVNALGEVRAEMRDLRQEMRELRQEMRELRIELNARLDAQNARLDALIIHLIPDPRRNTGA